MAPPDRIAALMARSTTITVRVPSPLRDCCDGAARIELEAPNVRAVLEALKRLHPALYKSVCDETGAVRRHVNVFVNSTHMRERDGLDTVLAPGDEVSVLPAVSGG